MTTIAAAAAEAAERLADAGIADARREARYLVCHVLDVGPEVPALEPARALDDGACARLAALVARRAAREPFAKVVGVREFWSLKLRVGGATLDPRPDSETVIEAALAAVPDRAAPISVLDFGTGSGCLLLALLSELPAATGVGVDKSLAALHIAYANSVALGLAARARFVAANWGDGLAGRFDLIVANPPYIPSGEIAALAPEVALHEPRAAIDGGSDGLSAYRALAPHIARLLAPGGMVALEIGLQQADGVSAILHDAGLNVRSHAHDLAGNLRCIAAARA